MLTTALGSMTSAHHRLLGSHSVRDAVSQATIPLIGLALPALLYS